MKIFPAEIQVLLAKETTVQRNVKWPVILSRFTGPYNIKSGLHPCYVLKEKKEKKSRRAVHARRLLAYLSALKDSEKESDAHEVIILGNEPRVEHSYTAPTIHGSQISSGMNQISRSRAERQVLANFLIHCYLCFRKLHRQFSTPENLHLQTC